MNVEQVSKHGKECGGGRGQYKSSGDFEPDVPQIQRAVVEAKRAMQDLEVSELETNVSLRDESLAAHISQCQSLTQAITCQEGQHGQGPSR